MRKTNVRNCCSRFDSVNCRGSLHRHISLKPTTSSTTSSSGVTGIAGVTGTASSNGVIQIVAAENFWGSLVSQLGGTHVNVTSIVTDPNADPHEYESNAADAIAIANAQFVIINGAGYDTWASQLIAASDSSNQVVLNVQELINQTIDANPHFWYSPYYVNDTVNCDVPRSLFHRTIITPHTIHSSILR